MLLNPWKRIRLDEAQLWTGDVSPPDHGRRLEFDFEALPLGCILSDCLRDLAYILRHCHAPGAAISSH